MPTIKLNLLLFFIISQFILTENEFVCGIQEEFYLVSISQSSIHDTIEKIEGIENQKIKDSVWKLIYNDENEFEVIYKDGRKEKVAIQKKCFIRKKRHPEINFISPEIIELIFDIPPGDEIKTEVSLGQITEIEKEKEKLKVKYKRAKKTPHEDIIFISSAKNSEGKEEEIFYFFDKIKIPAKITLEGETEPESRGKIKIGKKEIEFVSDKKGKFSVSFYVNPGDEKFKIILIDKAGNRSEEEFTIPQYTFEEPELSPPIIKIGKKILIINLEEEEIKFTKDEFSKEPKIVKIDESSSVFIPEFGKYNLILKKKILTTEKKKIPYNISVYPEKNTVEATGEEKIKIEIEIEDIIGNRIKLDEIPIKFYADFGKIKREGKHFLFWAEKMPDEVNKYDIGINFETEFTSEGEKLPKVFLRATTQISLIPGKPKYIYIETQDRSFIKGDGKDKVEIKVKVKDIAGNTIFLNSSTIQISSSVGGIKILEKNEKELRFSISHKSELDDIIKIKLEYGQLSETLNIRVIGTKIAYDISMGFGVGTNFWRTAFRIGPKFELIYFTRTFNFIFGIETETLAKFDKIKIYSIIPMFYPGLQRRITSKFSIKAKNSFFLNLLQIEFENIKENMISFGTEPSISFIIGGSSPFFSVSLSYLLNLKELTQTEFLRFKIQQINYLFIKIGASYIF